MHAADMAVSFIGGGGALYYRLRNALSYKAALVGGGIGSW